MFPEAWGDGFFHNCVSLTFTMLRAARGGTETHSEGGHGAPCSQGLCPRAWISVGGQHGKLRDWEADIQF